MKQILLLGFFLIFFAMEGEAIAQCKTGYTPMQINMNVNGCPYVVDLCIKCSVLGQLPGSVYVRGFMQIPMIPPCVQTLTAQQVLQYIETYVTSPEYYYTWLCQNQYGTPPCPDQSQPIEMSHWSCWKVEMIEYFGQQSLYYHICGDAYCYEKFSWCYDSNLKKYNKTVIEGPTQIGTPSCTLEALQIILPTQVGQESPCFIMHNACQ